MDGAYMQQVLDNMQQVLSKGAMLAAKTSVPSRL